MFCLEVKRRFAGLHQITTLGSTEIENEYEPTEEGLNKVTQVTLLACLLSLAWLWFMTDFYRAAELNYNSCHFFSHFLRFSVLFWQHFAIFLEKNFRSMPYDDSKVQRTPRAGRYGCSKKNISTKELKILRNTTLYLTILSASRFVCLEIRWNKDRRGG